MISSTLNEVECNEIKKIGKTQVPGPVLFRHSNWSSDVVIFVLWPICLMFMWQILASDFCSASAVVLNGTCKLQGTNILRFQLFSTSTTYTKNIHTIDWLYRRQRHRSRSWQSTRTLPNKHIVTSNTPCYCFFFFFSYVRMFSSHKSTFLLKKTLHSIIPHTDYIHSYWKGNSFQGSQCIRDSCIAQLPAETSEHCRCGSCKTWIRKGDNPKHSVPLLFPSFNLLCKVSLGTVWVVQYVLNTCALKEYQILNAWMLIYKAR